jgi:subfamily B ATP-binding cassette protein MsbA
MPRKDEPLAPADMPRFFLAPFLKYLRPHILRLTVAFFAMIAVGVFGSFTILILKPPLEILFGAGKEESGRRAVEEVLADSRDVFDEALGQWRARGAPDDPLFERLAELEAALDEPAAEGPGPEDEAKDSLIDDLPGARRFLDWSAARFAPLKNAAETRYNAFERWMLDNPLSSLWVFAGVIVGFTLLKGLSEYTAQYLLGYTFAHVVIKLKEDIFRHIMGQDYSFFISRSTGFLSSRVKSDVSKIKSTFDGLISEAVQQPIKLACLLVVLLYLSPQLTWITLICIAVGAIPLLYFAKQIKRVTKKSKKTEDELSSTMVESLSNFRVIKIFGAEEYEVRKFRKLNDRLFKLSMKRRVARFASSPIMEFIGSIGAAVVLLVGGVLVLGKEGVEPTFGPVTFLLYLFACTRFYAPMKKLSRLNIQWQVARISALRILEIMNTKPDVSEAPDARPIERFDSAVELKGVCFAYDQTPVLDGVDLRLEKGKVVALIGRSGAGKTTLANLLPRLFDPSDGTVEIDGQDIRRLKLSDLRALFGVVTQDTILFNETVRDNIAYSEKRPDQERVDRAAQAAYAHDFIEALEGGRGYGSLVGPDGCNLSGGQRQRLAIARALYRDPQILIFDEATSSLDVESERFVQRAIDNLLDNRTALVIAHRLSTIRRADEIVVLDGGRVVERGTHESLLAARGEYERLYRIGLEDDPPAEVEV